VSEHEAIQALEALYAELPAIECKGECAHSCKEIVVSHLELRRIVKRRRVRMRAREMAPVIRIEGDPCPYLRHGRCTVYEARPMLCRLWGLTEEMVCPHGCEPERQLTQEEFVSFMRRAKELDDRSD
jgi:Fe-S-cluster containining protein